MVKKAWQKPQLIVLMRGSPEQTLAILDLCKGNVEAGSSPEAEHQGCRNNFVLRSDLPYCSPARCKYKTEGFSGFGENACPGADGIDELDGCVKDPDTGKCPPGCDPSVRCVCNCCHAISTS